ncbi:MaoC family dehydratase [Singulisphaera rosea]
MTNGRYLEDFAPGQTFESATVEVEAGRMKDFAGEFDPQPFHIDEEAAASSFFGGLVASGWHTAALTMKLLVGSELNVVGGLIGAGVEELKWPRPVHPGDTLHLHVAVEEVRPSQSRPDRGIIMLRTTTLNQDDQPVMSALIRAVAPRRPA